MKNNPSVKVKNYFSSFSEANSERYAYLSLLDAAESLNKKCNIYAVVHSILKVRYLFSLYNLPFLMLVICYRSPLQFLLARDMECS